ncbi:MAG: helix-turn-helix domain containing protein [Proteobacteria bacterium]|nr:helix-turn-helix domain containing protein [Pseudomonadota bacterium]
MEVRDRILEAALGLLAESGAHQLTQPKVSKAAGVRQGHLTYYFPTRADLLQAVAQYSIGKLVGQLAHDHPATPAAVAQGIAAGSTDKRRVRVMLGLVAAADRDPAIRKRMRGFITKLREQMAPAHEAGGLKTDPESIAFFHSVTIGCAVLQLARDNAGARAEAQAVLRRAAAVISKDHP